MPSILIFSGEASGDLHGASLASSLKELCPDVELAGLGGPKMQAAGVQLISRIEGLDIIGVPTWSELRHVLAVFKKLSQYIKNSSADAIVLIDNPGFNLHLARVAKKSGHRVIYYIAPQIWAWNRSRINKVRKYIDRLLVILPFEEAYFRKAGVDCHFVGHPLMDELRPSYDATGLRAEFGLDSKATVIGLLPGSRRSEVHRLLPVILDAAARLADRVDGRAPSRQFVLARASSVPLALIESFTAQSGLPIRVISDRAYDVVAVSDALIVASGTATLQTALVGRPMIIVYRTSILTYQVFRWLIKVPWIGLANLVVGRQIAKELVQNDVTSQRLSSEIEAILSNPNALKDASQASTELRTMLGSPGASDRAAAEIIAMMNVM